MEIRELMIGDWVLFRHKDTIKPFQVAQIRESAFDGKLDVWSKDGNMGYDCVEPIPLTNGILEKNGFIPLDGTDDNWWVKGKLRLRIWCSNWLRVSYDDVLNLFHNNANTHDLQHALRLCGLNDLADNFKL